MPHFARYLASITPMAPFTQHGRCPHPVSRLPPWQRARRERRCPAALGHLTHHSTSRTNSCWCVALGSREMRRRPTCRESRAVSTPHRRRTFMCSSVEARMEFTRAGAAKKVSLQHKSCWRLQRAFLTPAQSTRTFTDRGFDNFGTWRTTRRNRSYSSSRSAPAGRRTFIVCNRRF